MINFRKATIAALVSIASVAASQNASAQMFPSGPAYFPPVMVPAPVFRPVPPIMPRPFPMPYNGPLGFPHQGGGLPIDFGPFGPAIGTAVTGGLINMGVPAPAATWAGGRVRENAGSANRERTIGDAIIRTTTGISPRDIDNYGWQGGPNSEVNKVLDFFGF